MVSPIGPEVLSIQLFLILLHTLYIKNVFRNPKAKQSIYSDTDRSGVPGGLVLLFAEGDEVSEDAALPA